MQEIIPRCSKEQFYDKEIAPALQAVAAMCAEKGFSFVASVEFLPGEFGTVTELARPPSLSMVMLDFCAKCADNLDGYVIGLIKFCKEAGVDYSKSAVMTLVENHKQD